MRSLSRDAEQKLSQRKQDLLRLWKSNVTAGQEATEQRPADWPDLAQQREGTDVLEHLTERERLELEDIDAAMDRLRKGTFGACERCGGPIGRQRLRALPQARFCILCEDQVERR